jgi:transposase
MDTLYPHGAGIDVHKQTLVVCVRHHDGQRPARQPIRTFPTHTQALLQLSDWLAHEGVTPVAMESTGVYWKPIYNLLEGCFQLLLVNAQHIKQVPGRKTDVKDCAWSAQLLQHGLLKARFVPPTAQRELRELTRQRAQVVNEQTRVANRIQKVLEDANITRARVASDILGVSGRAMLEALIGGEEDPEKRADRAQRRRRGKIPQWREALQGRVAEHHRFLLRLLLDHLEHLASLVGRLSVRSEEFLKAQGEILERLASIPGVKQRVAEGVVAEVGPDGERFPTAAHLASWAGLCPGNNERAGKRRSGKTTKGSPWLRATLVQAAWAAAHTKET